MNILTTLFSGVKSFLSSNYVSYGIIAILSLGGYLLYKDYINTMKENGQLKATLDVANAGTKQASDLANQNAQMAKDLQQHFQELLNELQRMEQEKRKLEASLRIKEDAFNKYKREADEVTKQCLKLKMPEEVFGSYVEGGNTNPIPAVGNVTSDKLNGM